MKKILFILTLSLVAGPTTFAEDLLPNEITVYKKPDCECCNKWIKYLRSNGYKVTEINTRNLSAEKKHCDTRHAHRFSWYGTRKCKRKIQCYDI